MKGKKSDVYQFATELHLILREWFTIIVGLLSFLRNIINLQFESNEIFQLEVKADSVKVSNER